MYRTVFWTLWEKSRVGCFERTASKHVYYLGWNRSPAQVGCMRQALGAGALGRPRGIGWRGRWERGSGWGTHVNPWLIHFNVWQNPLQKKKKKTPVRLYPVPAWGLGIQFKDLSPICKMPNNDTFQDMGYTECPDCAHCLWVCCHHNIKRNWGLVMLLNSLGSESI